MNKIITWQKQTGTAYQIDDTTIIPQSQLLQIKLPFGGFVWHRPTGILVERNGRLDTIPIRDVTRIALWTLFGLTILINLFIFIGKRR